MDGMIIIDRADGRWTRSDVVTGEVTGSGTSAVDDNLLAASITPTEDDPLPPDLPPSRFRHSFRNRVMLLYDDGSPEAVAVCTAAPRRGVACKG